MWNRDDTFDLDPKHIPLYRKALKNGLYRLDLFEHPELDQIEDWPENVQDWPNPNPWIDLLMDDFLIVDLRFPTDAGSDALHYLDIEMLEYCKTIQCECPTEPSVGGRLPNENIIQRMLTVQINGLCRPMPSRGVGVDEPARPTVDTFPFVPVPFESGAEQ